MKYLRFDGYRVKSLGKYSGGGIFISHGHLCKQDCNSEKDIHVSIYYVQGIGYQYAT